MMACVTKPGGWLAVCEFSTPVVPVFSNGLLAST